MSKVYDRLIAYTDGSHISNDLGTGTGAGVYGYGINGELFKSKKGYMADGIPEALTAVGFEVVTESTKPGRLPKGAVDFVKGVIPLPPSTAQVGELMAFVSLMRHAPFKAKQYIIITDSSYLKNAYTNWIDGWARRGWIGSDGSPIKNLKIIQEIKAIKDECKSKHIGVQFVKIKGHSGRWGNVKADEAAGRASSLSATSPEFIGNGIWDAEEHEELDNNEVVETTVDLNEIQAVGYTRFAYVGIGENTEVVEHGGKKFYRLLHGNHAKNADDIVLLGKMVPDTIFGLAYSTKPWENVHLIANEHNRLAWEGVAALRRYDPICIVNLEMVKRKNFVNACTAAKGLPVSEMRLVENNNVWGYGNTVISRLLRPPLLSYRALEIRNELERDLQECLNEAKSVRLNDITPLLFDEKGKPRKDFYTNVDKSIKFLIKIPNSDKKITVVMARNIDMPERSQINRIYEPGGKFYIAAFRRDKQLVRYALFYRGVETHGIWCGYYSCNRFLSADEI